MEFVLKEQKILQGVPSASGLVKHQDFFYIVGDDSPFLFKLNAEFDLVERIHLIAIEPRVRIPKAEKADFEALEMISEDEMLAFGSGSLSPQRDVMVKITLASHPIVKTTSLTRFYSVIKQMKIMEGSELNIEAVAFHKGKLLLFNRRKNIIFGLPYSGFMDTIEGDAAFPEIQSREYQLPEIQGVEAGFSGAAVSPSGKLLVTSSVEDTDNAYDDGEVLGSFVGISTGSKNDNFSRLSWTAIPSKAPIKVESILVNREVSPKELELILVTDSDGANSLLIKGTLYL